MSQDQDHVDRVQAQWRAERPEIDTSPMGIIARLHRIADALRGELLALYREHGLGEGEFDILATLRRSGAPFELTPSELAQQTMVTTGAVSKRLDRLETAGLVTRRENLEDARGRVVALSLKVATRSIAPTRRTCETRLACSIISAQPNESSCKAYCDPGR